MNDYSTIRIPADLHTPIEAVQRDPFADRVPLHVAEVDPDNPDEYGLAFYSDYGIDQNIDANQRATMIAQTVAPGKRATDAPVIMGDVVLLCDEKLATMLVQTDVEFQAESKAISAFRAWLKDYADTVNVDIADIFYQVAKYVDHVREESAMAASAGQVSRIAALLGINTDQIGVVIL